MMSEASNIDRVIGLRLRARRVSAGMNEAALALRVGVEEKRILDYEAGTARMEAETMRTICHVLDMQIVDFFKPWVAARSESKVASVQVAAE